MDTLVSMDVSFNQYSFCFFLNNVCYRFADDERDDEVDDDSEYKTVTVPFNRELKHAHFLDADGNRKRTFCVPHFYTNHP